jgi:hypothetical protein
MKQAIIFLTALFTILPIPGLCRRGEPATVGAIRWDAWYGEPTAADGLDPCSQVEATLSPAKYHWRMPFFGEITGEGKVHFPEYTQEIFDREMEYAIEAGLDYFAYVWYLNIPGMERAHQYHAASRYNTQVKMCSIFDGNAVNQQNVCDEIRGMIAQNYWQTVLDERPLMFYFQVSGEAMAADIAAYRDMCTELGIPAPYAVAMSGGDEMVAEYGADALSNYAIGGSGGMKYKKLISKAAREWTRTLFSGTQMVPCWSAGWNAMPRYETPVTWYDPGPDSRVADGTPEEIARMLGSALNWCGWNRKRAEANTVIGYAWNEHDEGGWLCPTLMVDANGNPTGGIDDARVQAFKSVIADYKSGNLAMGGDTMPFEAIGWAILGALGLFILITLLRAAFWKAKKVEYCILSLHP